MSYNFKEIEAKWQKKWESGKIFQVKEDKKKKKYYVLEMFPYPSASGLHMGHALNYTIGDVFARFMRMNGFNVLYPMGFDSLGLPAENAAIEAKKHPKQFTEKAIRNYIRQMKEIGLSYDWSRIVSTMEPEYYKWNQYFFLKFLENDLIHRKKAPVNFCKKCGTVLANEQVHNGKCWRHEDTEVQIKQLEQWFIKTTKYAEELLKDIEKLDWPERVKIMQRNWIGKSEGAEILFEVESNISKVVLMHGKDTSPNEKWYPWFINKIKEKNIDVIAQKLPKSDDPVLEEWLKEIDNTKPDENTVLVGHSRGGMAILRWLEKLPKNKRVKKVILVSSNNPLISAKNQDKNTHGFYELGKYNFDKIKSRCDDFVVIHSKDDEWVPFESGEENAEGLGAKFKIYEDKGHFGRKVLEVPEILEEVINNKKFPIFTTRPDTLFGVTFMVVSAQHPELMSLATHEQKKDVEAFLKKIKTTKQEDLDKLDKEGVFTGSYAIHPLTKDKIPIWAGNFVVADYGSGMVMAVPAHDQRDFEFAKKYNLEIKQVIAPHFKETKGKDAVREGKKTVERKAVLGIVKHWKENKFFCLDWKKFSWKTLVIGGIDEGETPEEAIKREVIEETGYTDIKSVKRIGFETHSEFFARHKDVNRYGRFKTFLIELKSSKYKKPEEKHVKNHDGLWVKKEDMQDFLSLNNHKYIWEIYDKGEKAFTDYGILINSKGFNNLNSREAKEHITISLKEKKLGKKTVQYKLRDWLVSRQRYWGAPIPVVYCEKCGIQPVKEKDLPVLIPEKVKFGKGNPLATNKNFLNAKCPKCGKKGKRETDTMDTFFDSSWYFLRFCDDKNNKKAFDKNKIKYWMPVDQYIGGIEHACMHLIYARFFTKVLRDLGLFESKINEPFTRLFNQGMLHGEDGEKMSKSKGNVINPDEVSKRYGMDTARFFLLSLASPEKSRDWSEKGISGSLKFMNKVIDYFDKVKIGKSGPKTESKLNKTIKEVAEDIRNFRHNFATIKIRNLFGSLSEEKNISRKDAESFLKILHPFCPHITEELWQKIGNKNFLSLEKWPKADEKKIDENLEKQEEIVNKVNSDTNNVKKILNIPAPTFTAISAIPSEKKIFESNKNLIQRVTDSGAVFITSPGELHSNKEMINLQERLNKVDPDGAIDFQNKLKKASPGKPGLFVSGAVISDI